MHSRFTLACLFGLVIAGATVSSRAAEPSRKTAEAIQTGPRDWPWWRGPQRNGVAAADQAPPLAWSATENVLWKCLVPGRGHGSPIVVGDQVFLATADHETQVQALQCVDRLTGKELWRTEVHQGQFETKGNSKSSLASSTPACDGHRVFINFLHAGAIWTTALNLKGEKLWQKKISDYVLHQGFGSSPALYQSLVIISADNKGGGLIAALDRVTGELVWTHERPKFPNYASPVILNAGGREQLFLIGCDLVTSLDPLSGKTNWEIPGSTTECVTSTVTDGDLIYTSGGYPKNHISAVRADGSGKIAWENGAREYVPSMLIKDGALIGVLDEGIAKCWRANSGKELWTGRLGGTFSASPVLAGDLVFATNEAGKTYVFKAQATKFEKVAENQLGDEAYATPTVCGGRIYFRVAHIQDGKRQEMLYCVGKE